jgi:hypothetical protein
MQQEKVFFVVVVAGLYERFIAFFVEFKIHLSIDFFYSLSPSLSVPLRWHVGYEFWDHPSTRMDPIRNNNK